MSENAFCRACGIPTPMLHRFVKDGREIGLGTVDRLVAFFGCESTEPVWDRAGN